MYVKRYTLALLIGGAFAPAAQAGQGNLDYSPEWWLNSLNKACQTVADGVARCLAGPTPTTQPAGAMRGLEPLMPPGRANGAVQASAPFNLPALPSPFPGMDPKTNPYLVHTPYARQGDAQGRPGYNGQTPVAAAPGLAGTPGSSTQSPSPLTSVASTSLSPSPSSIAASSPGAIAATQPGAAPTPAPATSATMLSSLPFAMPSPTAIQALPGAALASSTAPSAPSPLPTPSEPTKAALAGVARPGDAPALQDAPAPVAVVAHRQGDTETLFAFDKAELTGAGRAALDAWLTRHPSGLRARITGHADRFGRQAYNLALSRRRAENVVRYLVDKGMKQEDLLILAKGETQPKVTCAGGLNPETVACLAPNRRVEISGEGSTQEAG